MTSSPAKRDLMVLGIETSCDETAVAIVGGDRRVHANVVLSQIADHQPYGGVVPEIAARAHLAHLDGLLRRALTEAGVGFDDVHAVAATAGPGLIGGVLVGAMTGKAIALARDLPFLAVNHLEGHALTARLSDDVAYPYLLLLVSGGHCQLLAVAGLGDYRLLGTTIDDAVGEAFDKVAKMLDLGYPGGPAVERAAATGDPLAIDLPRPMRGRPGADFSFSGLKTAVRQRLSAAENPLDPAWRADLAASFQAAVADCLVDRTAHAITLFSAEYGAGKALVVAGGVAANASLRARLSDLAAAEGMAWVAPAPALCTDNAAMIAWAGLERFAAGQRDGLDFAPRPRWPLDTTSAGAS